MNTSVASAYVFVHKAQSSSNFMIYDSISCDFIICFIFAFNYFAYDVAMKSDIPNQPTAKYEKKYEYVSMRPLIQSDGMSLGICCSLVMERYIPSI